MKLPKYLTAVTPLSKTLALIIFIFAPIIGFILGMEYKQMQISSRTPIPPVQIIVPSSKPSAGNNVSWSECIKMSGSRILQTYPGVCITSDGRQVSEPVEKPSWNDCSTNPKNKILQTEPLTCMYSDGTKVTAPPNDPNL